MGRTCAVGGARGIFEATLAREVAERIDQAFGAEGDWDGETRRGFGELDEDGLTHLRRQALAEFPAEEIPNLLALDAEGRGVYLPANVQAVALPLSAGGPLRCASLTGLRRELFDLAERWELPVDDDSLTAILQDAESGGVADAPEVLAFARLTLAANEAMRRDCPLWLVG
jgi:hypothetical protein